MAVSIYEGTFLKPAAPTTGTQQISGIPFLPKALYVFSAGREVNATYELSRWFCHGVATASAQGVCATNGLEGGSGGVTGCSGYVSDTEIMAFTYNNIFGPNIAVKMAFVSFDTIGVGNHGFTIDTTMNGAGGGTEDPLIVHYVAFGGDTITDVVLTEWATGVVPGTYPITGVGFRPDAMLNIGIVQAPNGVMNGAMACLSACNCALEQWALTNTDNTFSVEPVFPIRSLRQQLPDYSSATLGFLGGVTGYTRLVSMDADGWTTAVDAAAGESLRMFSLCFKGLGTNIGAFNKRTAGTGTQTVPVVGLTPSGMLFASDQVVTSGAIEDYARIGVGFWDGTRQGAVAAISPTDSLTGYGGIDYNNAAFVKINNTAGTVDALAVGVTLNSTAATLNWTTNDSTATEILYCIFGEGGAGTCDGIPAEPVEAVWEVPDVTPICIPVCVVIVNDNGEPLAFSPDHCAACLPQPFFPQLFADSERKSVLVPVQNNLIQFWVNSALPPENIIFVNDDLEILDFVTTALVLSKSNVSLFGHYLGWHVQGTDAPFRLETVEMEFGPNRVWDTTP